MLLFKPEHIPLIRDGSKTQTRRRWKQCRVKVGSVHQVRVDFRKGGRPVARVRILRTWKERLADISEEDSRAEGCVSPKDFLDHFARIGGLKINGVLMNVIVTAVEFEFIPDDELICPKCGSDMVYQERFAPPGMPPFYCDDCGHEGERTVFALADERRCRVCGCTDDRACPGGCHWVEEDLCSSCVEVSAHA